MNVCLSMKGTSRLLASQVMGKPLPYDSISSVRQRMADIAPHLADARGVHVESSSIELANLNLAFSPSDGVPLSGAPLVSCISNFYMTDPISRASETMAKCYQTFGSRV